MQVVKDLPVGPKNARLVVGDVELPAEVFDYRLHLFKLVAGHTWEEVVFDLVVEASVPEVGDRVCHDVAAGQYLAVEEVYLAVLIQKRHGLVVGREDRDHEQAEQPAVDGDEQRGL